MPYALHNLRPAHGSQKRSRRLGRGHGSGRGKTSGRGTKGQKARTGGRKGLKRLGMRRILLAQPKRRGFTSIYKKPAIVNIGDLDRAFAASSVVTPAALVAAGLLHRVPKEGVKVLGRGAIAKPLTLRNLQVSGPTREKIESVGGKVEGGEETRSTA